MVKEKVFRNSKTLSTLPWSCRCPRHQGALHPILGPVPTQELPMLGALVVPYRPEPCKGLKNGTVGSSLLEDYQDPRLPFFLCSFASSPTQSFFELLIHIHCVQALGKWWTRHTSLCSHGTNIPTGTKGSEETNSIMSDGGKCYGEKQSRVRD